MKPAEPTTGSAGWTRFLAAVAGDGAAEVVSAALRGVDEKRNTLSARLSFGTLSLKLRQTPLTKSGAEPAPGVDVPAYFVEDILGRMTFLVGLSELLAPADLSDVMTTLYRTGSDREQISVLRALPFLPEKERLVGLAREASRTNDVAVFSALACDSDFPSRCLPDPAFEQLVLKALFMGVPVTRILDVETRVTAELKRMIADFASERRAAGRTVPSDVPWLLALGPTPT